ncbi:glycosyltransferase [Lacisediminihabitans profunda]|uniref:glycosyltransferase n=1 Tax=Lacisediminihabitans profunda TaxID=2594790 RepID=UPI00164FB8A2|nr:glycosyltransferase [Lacisediminihabitans profunda]
MRLYDWVSRLNLTAEKFQYLGRPTNGARALARNPPALASAEIRLRGLRRHIGEQTLVLSRLASPLSSGTLEESLLKQAKHGVYDFDDAIWSDTSGLAKKLWSRNSLWQRAVRAADIVIAGSDYLAEAASTISRRVVMIPSCVEPSLYSRKTTFDVTGPPKAVWIGSPATEQFLKPLLTPLLELNKRYGLRLILIGATAPNLGAMESMVDRQPWSLSTFGSALSQADFGIMPLPDNEYTRGKCSYKLLQYGAAGLPVIGSPVGANASVLQRMGGLAATTPIEWYDAMASILEIGADERLLMGTRAHETVNRDFSFDRWQAEWTAAVGPASVPNPIVGS